MNELKQYQLGWYRCPVCGKGGEQHILEMDLSGNLHCSKSKERLDKK